MHLRGAAVLVLSGVLVAATPPNAKPSKATVELEKLRAAMSAKGILVDDLPEDSRVLLQEAQAALTGKKAAKSLKKLKSVAKTVDALVIDAAFVEAKLTRLNKRATGVAIDPQRRSELLLKVTRAHSDGRYEEANQALNELDSLLTSQPAPESAVGEPASATP